MRIAAIDQGTTSTRCLVFWPEGWHVAASRGHQSRHPAPTWVEQDPEELLANIATCLRAAGPVDAIGLANQGESCLAWDAVTGQALSPVITWQDARTADSLAARPPHDADLSRRISGLPLDPYFSASKLAWLMGLPPVAAAHAAGRLRLGTTDAFFLDRLAGVFATDAATASRTGLLDLTRLEWSPDLCALHGVPLACLPPIRAQGQGFGVLGGVPVRASIVDQQAALYGHGLRAPGEVKITFGTGAFLLALTGPARPEAGGLLPTLAWQREAPVFALEGGVYDAGAAVDWARRIGLFADLAELDGFTGPSALSRGLVFVPALSGLAAPHWDRRAAPLFLGMGPETTRQDMTRAVLEGIALLTCTLIEEAARAMPLGATISVDGGLSQSAFFCNWLATASGRTITVPPMHELTALGLADLCGADVARFRAGAAVFAPGPALAPQDRARFAEAIARAKSWR